MVLLSLIQGACQTSATVWKRLRKKREPVGGVFAKKDIALLID
ncbi:hypothetical protein FLA_2104 [Filimonas lacunae]|nr:hypothetical protein FLA_2104 [Filimonas lacunae]